MRCPKCDGEMESNRIRTHLVWVDELDCIPDTRKQLGPTIAYLCNDCGYIEFYRERN